MAETARNRENAGLEPNVIQGFLKLKKISQQSIAREGGVTEECVSQVISRKTISRNMQEIIAKRLGLPYEFVWGKESQGKAA